MTHHRLEACRRPMGTVQALMIRTTESTIYNYHAHCRIDPAANAPITRSVQQRKRLLTPLSYATQAQSTISLDIDYTKIKKSRWNHHTYFLNELFNFWAETKVATTTEDLSGITWIGILTISEIRTGQRTPCDLTKPQYALQPVDRSPTIHTILRSFKTVTLNILKQASQHPGLKWMITTNHKANQRPRQLGTYSSSGGTNFNLTINEEEAKSDTEPSSNHRQHHVQRCRAPT